MHQPISLSAAHNGSPQYLIIMIIINNNNINNKNNYNKNSNNKSSYLVNSSRVQSVGSEHDSTLRGMNVLLSVSLW